VDYGGVAGPDWYAGAAARIAAALGPEPAIAVLHSGAGALLPSILEAMSERLAGAVLVDALMPHPGRSWVDTAPPALAARVRAMAQDGLLPPWDRWWGAEAMARLLPDAGVRAAFAAELPRVPLAFFEAQAPEGQWTRMRGAYLQLSEAYAEEARQAAALGWPVWREASTHLAMLTEPERIGAGLIEMAQALAGG